MDLAGRLARIGIALVVFWPMIALGSTPIRAAHPGANGGLTYPVKDGIRVHPIGGSAYDLPFAGATDLSWTPDGRFLAFVWNAGEENGIYVADAAGCNVQQATSDPLDRAPSFDGVHMYFTRGTTGLQLDYDLDADAFPVSGEAEPSGYGTDVAVSILEGRWAHVEPPNSVHPDEYVLKLVDVFLRDEEVEVFRSEHPIRGTEWAPDGSLLAFEAMTDDGTVQIFTADVVGDPIEVVQVTDEFTNAMMPAFSPMGDSLAWYRGAATRQSGTVQVRDLASGDDTFLTQQARFALDWQPLHDGPWAPAVPTETETAVTLDAPSTGPGSHPFTVTVSPAPVEGTVEVVVDGGEPSVLSLDASGIAHGSADLEAGAHLVSATFAGSCPFLASAGEVGVDVPEPEPSFQDIGDSPFADEIEWLVEQGITTGCAPDLFCPDGPVTRGQMASFIARALDLPSATTDHFADDDGTTHEEDINRLAEAGITSGCGSAAFCPSRTVTRAEMASFLARALDLEPTTTDWFDDDDGKTHEANINRLAEAGITTGCGPRRFCPTRTLTREQMAAFLYRALS